MANRTCSPGTRLTEINRQKHLRMRNHRSLAVPGSASCVPACRRTTRDESLMSVFMVFFICYGLATYFFRSPAHPAFLKLRPGTLLPTPKLRQRNILQLPDTLPRNAEILTDILQSLWLSAAETETLRNNCLLPLIKEVEQVTHFVAQVLVAQ